MKISEDSILQEEFSINDPKSSVSKMWKKVLVFSSVLILLILIPMILFSIMLVSLNSELVTHQNDIKALKEETKTLNKIIETHEHAYAVTNGNYEKLIIMIIFMIVSHGLNLIYCIT